MKYTEVRPEFIARYKELSGTQKQAIDNTIDELVTSADQPKGSHHLQREPYQCSWSHRATMTLRIVYRVHGNKLVLLSCGSHKQAYSQKL